MSQTDSLNLILSTLSEFGVSVFAIISAVIAIGLAYLVFKFGWSRLGVVLDNHNSNHRVWVGSKYYQYSSDGRKNFRNRFSSGNSSF